MIKPIRLAKIPQAGRVIVYAVLLCYDKKRLGPLKYASEN
jgi:hypothetical protein